MTDPTSWLSEATKHTGDNHVKSDALTARITRQVNAILMQVASESRDQSQRVYTQAEMVRAIELAMELGRSEHPCKASR